jgi:hypothetical protein
VHVRRDGDDARPVRGGEPRERDALVQVDRAVVDAGEQVEVELDALHWVLLP